MTPEEAHDLLRRSLPADGASDATRAVDYSSTLPAVEVLWNQLGKNRDVIKLITDIMSSRRPMDASEEHFRAFERILRREYREFARKENFPGEADALSELTSIFERMSQIRVAPHLVRKSICAVAGGFSSGKSSLLNRLISADTDLLPTNITPTTSIPTYISYFDDKEFTINVFNHNGGSTIVGPQSLQEMTHGFGQIDRSTEGIPLKPVVDRVSIRTPELKRWSRVAFVDTPGYNTSPGGNSDVPQDEQVAMREVLAARFLIWVLDCGNGTLKEEDIGFVRQFAERRSLSPVYGHNILDRQLAKPPTYFVINKADKQPTDREAILREVTEAAVENRLPWFGVGLYSARDDDWYKYSGGTFYEFLEMIHGETVNVELDSEVKLVFDEYTEYHEREVKRLNTVRGLWNRLDLARDAEDGDGTESRLDRDLMEHANDIERDLDFHNQAAADARSLGERFVLCTQAFMSCFELPNSTGVGEGLSVRESDTDTRAPMHDFGDGNGVVRAHRHAHGGGWIADTARVMDSAYVGRYAKVFGSVEVSGNVRITGLAQVYGDAEIHGDAQVYGTAQVGESAQVRDNAKVFGNAKISGKALVEDHARVSGDAQVLGGTKVYGGAEVSEEAVVSGDAQVSGDARVSGKSRVTDSAWVRDNAKLSGVARVSGGALVEDHARVSGNAQVIGDAEVYGGAEVSEEAVVSGDVRVGGDARVSGRACVEDSAWVRGHADVSENAKVSGKAQVNDNAGVSGEARVYGNAEVCGNVEVSDKARVFGKARVGGAALVRDEVRVYGNATVFGNVLVYGNAQVGENAKVHGNAQVYGNAQVGENAKVHGNAQVYGEARVYGEAEVYDNAQVRENARVYDNNSLQRNQRRS